MRTKLPFFCLLFLTISVFGQDKPLEKSKELSFILGPSATKLSNYNISNDEHKTISRQNGANCALSYNRYFKNRIGFGIGLGYSSYKQTVYQKGLFMKSDQKDKDGNTYELWMNSNMTYEYKLNYLDVPVVLHLLLGNSSQFYGFVDAGIINSFLIEGTYHEKGSIENMGKYPTSNPFFNLVSQNNPYYGYEVNPVDKENTDKFQGYNASLHVSVGVVVAMTERLSLRVAPQLTKGLTDIIIKDEQGKDYQNIFGDKSGYKPTKTFSMGLTVGFVYNL
jgi:hypothetical protein